MITGLALSLFIASLAAAPATEAPPPPRVETYTAPTSVPLPALPPKPPRWGKRPGAGMITGGAIMLGTTYLFTSMAGAIKIDESRDAISDDPSTPELETGTDHRLRSFGYRLLVPVAGPFFAIPKARSALGAWGAATVGIVQLSGAILLLAGGSRYARYKRQRRWGFAALGNATGAHASLRVRF